jgi:FkbM family methyltransferase
VSLVDPYRVIARLLTGQAVSGIVDAGASTGRVARRFLRSFPQAKAYAFEPNPLYAPVLQQAAGEDPRLIPQALALSDRREVVELNLAESPGITSMFKPGASLQRDYPAESVLRETVRVQAVTLDQWRRELGAPAIELIKLDIQGAELKALRGAEQTLRATVRLVYTEVFFNPVYEGAAIFSEIDLYLRSNGFLLQGLFKPRAFTNGLLFQANAIYVHGQRLGF